MTARAALGFLIAATVLLPGVAVADCARGDLACLVLPDVPARPADLFAFGGTDAAAPHAMSSASAPTPLAAVGDVLPRGEYSIILDAGYYGLAPVSDGWVYMRVGADAFRVDWETHQVLERVTEEAGANF